MSVRILHAADFHLDSPYYALPEEKAVRRRKEARALLGRVAELANSERAQLVLLSGDLFDSGAAYWETQEMLIKMLSGIRAQVFIAPGNHDWYSARSPYAFMELPENVHIFKTPQIKCVELPELGCRVWGAGFTAPVCDPILTGFTAPKSPLVDIMVLHGELGGDRYNRLTAEDIAASGLDYLALGHVHSFSGVQRAGDTFYAYPGCLEGRGFDETGEKGVLVGTVGKGAADLRFVPLAERQYEIIDAPTADFASAEEAADAAIAGHAAENIVRVVLKGEAAFAIDTDELARHLEDRFFHAVVRDETVPARDIWQGADEDSLKGLFLKRMREKYDAAGEDARAGILAAARYGIAALEQREEWRP